VMQSGLHHSLHFKCEPYLCLCRYCILNRIFWYQHFWSRYLSCILFSVKVHLLHNDVQISQPQEVPVSHFFRLTYPRKSFITCCI
jgi:hypothetical protein